MNWAELVLVSAAAAICVGVIFAVPSKETPPIVLAVAKAVAVEALPVTSPVKGHAKASEVTVPSKNASLNYKEDVPRSRPASVTGYSADASKVNSVELFILKSISFAVPKSIAV